MNDDVPHVRVVSALIERQGRYLITQRRSTAVLADLWEFPSGRVETGETDEVALRRELQERVGVDVDVVGAIACRKHRYDGYVVEMVLYRASLAPAQEPHAVRVADVRWVAPQELENFAFPPADQPTTDLLFGINHDTCSFMPEQAKPARA
jgi:8-oxo-dGTP diphosphatase